MPPTTIGTSLIHLNSSASMKLHFREPEYADMQTRSGATLLNRLTTESFSENSRSSRGEW
ncbi:MAG TPA: hypothetical protein PKH33_14845 [bacterium]|nr:hypothetical protein [bacterium]